MSNLFTRSKLRRLVASLAAAAYSFVFVSLSFAGDKLPEGENGIAARYAGGAAMEKDPDVIFVEHFDAKSLGEVVKSWEAAQGEKFMSLAADVPAGSADGQSLLVTHIGGEGENAYLYRRLAPGYHKLHYRFYVKFADDCTPIHHFFHVGGYNPMTSWPQGGAGERPDGRKRFSSAVEPFGDMWQWDYYSYWHQMGGSPPRGQTWGNSFVHDPLLKVKRNEWICVELMMKLNDVGKSNGEMALWIDGKLISHLGPGFPVGKWVYDKFQPGQGGGGVRWSDAKKKPEYFSVAAGGEPFEGFSWRTDEKLNLNFLWMLCYITKAPRGHASKIWFDEIVVAKEYIGPITAGK